MKIGIGKAILLAVCLGVAGSPAAQIYRHVDEHGVVHFSDAPVAQDSQVIDQADLDALTTTVPGTELPDAAQQRATAVALDADEAVLEQNAAQVVVEFPGDERRQ